MTTYRETWADIKDDPNAAMLCAERWKKVAARIGCTVRGFKDGNHASFYTPDGVVIKIGPKFRSVIEELGETR